MSIRQLAVITVVVVVAALLLLPISIREDRGWVDAVSGSHQRQTIWFWAFPTRPRLTPGAIETRLRAMGMQWQYDWRLLYTTPRDVFGRATSRGCGFTPPIYPLHGGLGQDFVNASTDNDLREFFRTMQSGSNKQQEAAVDAAIQKALRNDG